MNRACYYFFLMTFILALSPSYGRGPTLIRDLKHGQNEYSYGIGPMFKYKRVSGPDGFGGDMGMWGLRFHGGKLEDPALGAMYVKGHLNGTSQKLVLEKWGLTLEDSFRQDPRMRWRVAFGKGEYQLTRKISGTVSNEGSFAFVEPMISAMLPLSRHISLEFGAGYTFAGATGMRIEGLTLNTELLFGKL